MKFQEVFLRFTEALGVGCPRGPTTQTDEVDENARL